MKNREGEKPMNNDLPEGFYYEDDLAQGYQEDNEEVVMTNGSVAIDDLDELDNQALFSQEPVTKSPLTWTAPTRHDNQNDSRNRIKFLKDMVGHEVPDSFDPHEISWVLPNLGVTGAEGAENAIKQGHFTINVAGELGLKTTVKMPIEPSNATWGFKKTSTVLPMVEQIVNTMEMAMATDQKVVVNCSMGMERSVLATVWYLVRNKGMSLDNAYSFVRSVRPIATDRREWLIA
jgi:hypothetical protein